MARKDEAPKILNILHLSPYVLRRLLQSFSTVVEMAANNLSENKQERASQLAAIKQVNRHIRRIQWHLRMKK